MENINFTLNNELDLDNVNLSKSNFDNHTLLDEMKFFEGFVDLGLPSKTLWGKFNFGVDINCPFTNYNHFSGGYYAFGEIEEKKKELYSWENYKFGKYNELSKYVPYINEYITSKSIIDNKKVLDLNDDVVFVKSKQISNTVIKCIPTLEQYQELMNICSGEWFSFRTFKDKIEGLLVKSKINDNTLFFPASGTYNQFYCEGVSSSGSYAMNSVYDYDSNSCSVFYISKKDKIPGGYATQFRHKGCSIRPVITFKEK